jgi:hypothetical protein
MAGKKYLASCALFFLLINTHAQVLPSDCLCSSNMLSVYKNDAYRLTYKRIFELNSTYRDTVKIPADITDSIFKRLALVYNIPASPLRDSVFTVFGNTFTNYQYAIGEDSTHIHGNIPSLRSFDVSVQETEPWAANWLAGNITNTVNSQVNQLMITYGLTAQLAISIPLNGHWIFRIRAVVNYNTSALKNLFNTVSGVVNTSHVYPVGDGCTIDYTRSGNTSFLTYRFKCGDCPAGCLYQRNWYFKITDGDCAAEYTGTNSILALPPFEPLDCTIHIPPGGQGAPPTGTLPCTVLPFSIFALRDYPVATRLPNSAFRLSPNPAHDKLTIFFPQNIKKQKQVRVMDVHGRVIQELQKNDHAKLLTLNTIHLLPGVYYITISTDRGMNSLVFTKF